MLNRRFRPNPKETSFYLAAILSALGTLVYLSSDARLLHWIIADRWTIRYFLIAPFIHAGLAHFLLNIMALHFLGRLILLPTIGAKHFTLLLILAATNGLLLNNLFSESPAIGISAAVMGVLACSLPRYGNLPMKLLFIHDLLRLPPFRLRNIAIFVVLLDIAGIVFGWHFFAHWGHLGGFVTGLAYGYALYRPIR